MATTYSFKDSSGAFTHPLVVPFVFAGKIGLDSFTIAMNHERTVHEQASDGLIMVSYIAGDNGSVALQMLQTCKLHATLLGWYNAIKVLADNGNVTNWATAAVLIRNAVDGSSHVMTGVSPSKIPDKVYQAQGQKLVWNLLCADVQSLTIGVY